MIFHPQTRCPWSTVILLRVSFVSLVFSGCESTSPHGSSEGLVVQATSRDSSPVSAVTTATAERPTFSIRFYNASSMALLASQQATMNEALVDRGFQPAVRGKSPDMVVWMAALEGRVQREKLGSMKGAPIAGQDSIRNRNAARIMNRYESLMDDRHSGGQMMIGPEGEIIKTGSWAENVTDEANFGQNIPAEIVVHQRNVFAVWAITSAPPENEDDDGELWRVEVVHEYPQVDGPTDMERLVRTAMEYMGNNTEGPLQVDLP